MNRTKYRPRILRLRRLVALIVALLTPEIRAAEPAVTLDQNKAAVLLRMAEWTTWPATARRHPVHGTALVVGVVNAPGMVAAARAWVAADPKDRTVIVPVQEAGQAAGCHVLYFGQLDGAARQILAAARQRPVLTVGEGPEFLAAGGIVGFVFRAEGGEVIRDYHLSVPAMDRAKIRIDVRIVRKGLPPPVKEQQQEQTQP